MTCDVCERDIGHEDGRRPKAHYQITRHPNLGAIDDQDPPAIACSPACLRAFAAHESGTPPARGMGLVTAKPQLVDTSEPPDVPQK
ncbi:MAG: hypothetical protein JWN85_3218 [Gammaproteobacteria bacterium]|nr:hypothetical protein [Gammaproteobacteria bacterium]